MRGIEHLHPNVGEFYQKLERAARERKGIALVLLDTIRTFDEQGILFAKGRTAPGAKVTNAKGGYSMHNYMLAFDFALKKADGTILWAGDTNANGIDDFNEIGVLGKSIDPEFYWGGDFSGGWDKGHFEWRPAGLKYLVEKW